MCKLKMRMGDGKEGQCSMCGDRENERYGVAGCRETEK
jgi:hypothetical protein